MRELPIRTRLSIWYTLVLAIGLVVFSISIWFALRHLLYEDLRTSLANQAQGFEEYLHIEERDNAFDLVHEMDEYSKSMPEPHVLNVYDASGGLLYTSGARPWRHRQELAISRTFLLRRGRTRADFIISNSSTAHAVSLLGWLLALAVPVFVMAAAAGAYGLSRRALAPVDRITERAQTISLTNLSERLAVPATRDELARLTETWNAMLARLQSAVERISSFTADASHELRTPVAIIRLAAENALRKPREEREYRAALGKIQQASESMSQLIEDLLFLARTDAGESRRDFAPVEMTSLVEEAIDDLQPIAATKGIEIRRAAPLDPIILSGRAADIRRLLFILLDNAIKYSPENSFIVVMLLREDERVMLRVEDSGVGISEEARPLIFERFFRADSSRNKQSGGFGLGLAIARAIVERHSGSIEFHNRPEGGCVFEVLFTAGS